MTTNDHAADGAGGSLAWQGYDAMLFDLDGVITRTVGLHVSAWGRLFDEFLADRAAAEGVTFQPFDRDRDYRVHVDGRPRYEGVATFLASRGIHLPRGTADDPPGLPTCCGLGNRKNAYFAEELATRGVEVFADTVQLLDVLRAEGKRIAVVSASENCTALLARAGLLDRFDVRVTGVEARRWGLAGKPAPDTYLRAAELLGVLPSQAVVFEDAISGIKAGRAGDFGLVVGVDRDGMPGPLADAGADIVLDDLTVLLRMTPDQVLARPALHTEILFEGIVVCPPSGRARGLLDGPAFTDVVQRLRDLGVDIVVAGHDPRREVAQLAGRLGRRGIGAGLMLVVGWLSTIALPAVASRAAVVSVLPQRPSGLPPPMRWMEGAADTCVALLADQADRRAAGVVPSIDQDPAWTITVSGDDPVQRRAHQALLTVADTRFGTRGIREEEGLGLMPRVLAGGVFDDSIDPPGLLEGPGWTGLHLLQRLDRRRDRRTLDLRSGVLYREQVATPIPLRSLRFAALARPGCFALRAEGAPEWMHPGTALIPPATDGTLVRRQLGDTSSAQVRTDAGGAIAAATAQRERTAAGRHIVERLAFFVGDADGRTRQRQASAGLESVAGVGFADLLAEQRGAWARRWDDALVCIDGDPELELAVRFGLFHLMASVPTSGEAVVGPRGLSGPSYRGHVFWDADVFMLPFLAATCPPAARAMLEYRIRRLEPARQAAAQRGYRGARFPWESARTGVDVTPTVDRPLFGPDIPILTGEYEEHIVADVAWAAWQYAEWSGDATLLDGPGRPLLLDTARYWASRVRPDDSGGHIDDVIGPDEYHERVDDNVFTNIMARWNLRRAAELAEGGADVSADEIAQWRHVADTLVDNYDAHTGLYEQFDGYYALEPLMISDVAQTPVAADLLYGRPRISGSQVIKQPDVLMLHHLIPEETAPGSLRPNLEFYEPRCAHGSSLSPAIHAALLARDGRPDEALRLFRMACRLDLDNLTGTTGWGLHLATFGGVWQALVSGFAGIRTQRSGLVIDPHVPSRWGELRVRLQHHGRRLEVGASAATLQVTTDAPIEVSVPGAGTTRVAPGRQRWTRTTDGWRLR
ncbi:MAG: beta-phosphoglucomutase family hydrolase [Candidatus Nanopelagicales bacterium]|jgi:beta-phosphoglucomutase family hydrolase|nr:beta-phosphoglucomutase family hydrolase [Candidatus Nanopelagicales bacterium]